MNVFCLRGAGRICREAVLDLVEFPSFERIAIADINREEGERLAATIDDQRVDSLFVDVRSQEPTVASMRGYDVVMDGTPIALNGISTACIAEAGCLGINLNGFGEETASDAAFRKQGKSCVPGFGMTSGTTQMMAMYAADRMETVETVRVSRGGKPCPSKVYF